jgi:putative hydrolase of the HAD superfamily
MAPGALDVGWSLPRGEEESSVGPNEVWMSRQRTGSERVEHKAVIFDLFGTLVGNFSWEEHTRMAGEMALLVGAPREGFVRGWVETFDARARGVFRSVEANIEHVCAELGVEPDCRGVMQAAMTRFHFTRRCLEPREGAVETLAEIRRRGLKVGLVSDCSREVPMLWGDTPFAGVVDEAVFSCEVGMKKPEPAIYRLACERLGVEPEECVYVGDGSSRELSGAAAVGMEAVLIRVPTEKPGDAHRIEAEEWEGRRVSALAEVLGLVGTGGL